jgi:endonuclease III
VSKQHPEPWALFREAVDRIEDRHGPPPPLPERTAFEWVLWENAGYLAGDDKRAEAFARLRRTVGLGPKKILAAPIAKLRAVTKSGILPELFAKKLRECARIVVEELGGDLDRALNDGPGIEVKILRKFPGIGVPGAEKILLFTRRKPSLAPESNALRVLERVGEIGRHSGYGKAYVQACFDAREAYGKDLAAFTRAHLLLRRHGQEVCKRSEPHCGECALAEVCAFAKAFAERGGPKSPGFAEITRRPPGRGDRRR